MSQGKLWKDDLAKSLFRYKTSLRAFNSKV